MVAVKGRIKAANLHRIGQQGHSRAHTGQIMRLVQGRKGHQSGKRLHFAGPQHNRRHKIAPAMHNAMAHRNDMGLGKMLPHMVKGRGQGARMIGRLRSWHGGIT